DVHQPAARHGLDFHLRQFTDFIHDLLPFLRTERCAGKKPAHPLGAARGEGAFPDLAVKDLVRLTGSVKSDSRATDGTAPVRCGLGAAKECAGIRNLGDRVGLTEQIDGAGVSADSHSNLHGNVFLYDEIAEIDDIAELAEVEEPPVMPVMPVMSSTHGVEF